VIDPSILAAIEARLTRALTLPETRYRPLLVAGIAIGLLDDARAARLAAFDVFAVGAGQVMLDRRLRTAQARSDAFADIAATLRSEGALPAWRDELFAISTRFGAPPLFVIERGAARFFGLPTYAVHVNGVTHDGGATRMWLARRSPAKAVDPGLLDNLVGGGIAAGFRVDQTLVKEAFEEAGIDEAVARQARSAGVVHSVKPMFDGLQREMLFVHDLVLPRDFVPANQDGEAVEHRLLDLPAAANTIAATRGRDETTVDASLVVLDYLIRHGHVPADDAAYCNLDALLHRRVEAGASMPQ
jgi:8-oxo-dGTP pyrophosphatase MutT (NUDIX family)